MDGEQGVPHGAALREEIVDIDGHHRDQRS